jgi:putative phosphoesterase
MTRIIALSDTHQEEGLPANLADVIKGADLILHAGDFVSPAVYGSLDSLARLEAVCGNADSPQLKRLLPERRELAIEGVRIGLVHMASLSENLLGAKMLAREMEVEVLVFGHLHRPVVDRGERLLICPGSPTVPRMAAPTVAELEVEDGRVRGRIVTLGRPSCDYLRHAESLIKKSSKKIDF